MTLNAAASKELQKERTPRVDWAELLRKTFDFDVFACVRGGGRRRVLADVAQRHGARYPEDKLRIEGHTDSRGTEAYNEGLSLRRAQAVSRVLSARGVAPQQMKSHPRC